MKGRLVVVRGLSGGERGKGEIQGYGYKMATGGILVGWNCSVS